MVAVPLPDVGMSLHAHLALLDILENRLDLAMHFQHIPVVIEHFEVVISRQWAPFDREEYSRADRCRTDRPISLTRRQRDYRGGYRNGPGTCLHCVTSYRESHGIPQTR